MMMCLLFGAALFLSGARANILALLSIILIFTLRHLRRRGGWAPVLIVGTLIVILASATIMPKFTDTQEGSNAIKLKHIHSYEEEFGAELTALLWGEGANSAFYSEGFEKWTTVTEVTYLELARVFGLPMAFLFGVGLLWIGFRIFANGFLPIGLAYMGYLGIAGSNPLLINSTGFLVIAAMYEQAVRHPDASLSAHTRFRLWGPAILHRG